MVTIKEVNLDSLGVTFPESGVGMVVAQPFLSLGEQPPFACLPEHRKRLLDCVDATLSVSKARRHGAPKTHFTLFPECAIPGLEGIAKVDAAMAAADWPTGTVVLGGIEGLKPNEYRKLAALPNVEIDLVVNSLERLHPEHWVNCSVAWVKLGDGTVRRWVQPKISPAWVERDVPANSMYCGESIFLFRGVFENGGRPFRFHSLLCYDWTADVPPKRIWEWVMQHINELASEVPCTLPLTWVFVLQCNPAPSHSSFLGQVQPFFDQTQFKLVERRDTCLVMANVAGRALPGRTSHHGQTAILHASNVFTKSTCAATVSNGGGPYRPGNPLENISDSLFREGGACIHSFVQANPTQVPQGAAGKGAALREATVHPFPGTTDPRAPGGPVPAVIKWLNDNLDEASNLAKRHTDYELAAKSLEPCETTTAALRALDANAATRVVNLATAEAQKRTVDAWDTAETEAVEHVHNTLSLLQLSGEQCNIQQSAVHATTTGESPFDIVAVRATTHAQTENFVEKANLIARLPLVVVSRDSENTVWGRVDKKINETSAQTRDVKFTDPSSALRRIGYQTLVAAFQRAESIEQLTREFHAVLY